MAGSLLSKPSLFTPMRWATAMTMASVLALADLVDSVMAQERLAQSLGGSLMWVLQAPLQVYVLSLAHDWARRRGVSSSRMLCESLVWSVAIGVVSLLALAYAIQDLLGLEPAEPWSWSLVVKVGAMSGSLICGIWATTFVYAQASEQSAQRLAEAARLTLEAEHLRTAAELSHLRAQVEPHFLLNTLNMIAGLVTQNPTEARRLIASLGDLLQDTLRGAEDMQTLDSELVWLRRYCEILESRHGDALRFSWDIAPEALGWLLPRHLLQPLVENAVRHGALRREGGGHVGLSAQIFRNQAGEARLRCAVRDNGPGLCGPPARDGGIGLRSVRRRLQLECVGAELRVRSGEEGTEALVELPQASVALGASLSGAAS